MSKDITKKPYFWVRMSNLDKTSNQLLSKVYSTYFFVTKCSWFLLALICLNIYFIVSVLCDFDMLQQIPILTPRSVFLK